ncbi:hypothetical protein ACK8QS_13810 [Ectopseudomonas mendocina]
MLGLNLFIVGMEKCGTTSLADWLVSNRIATYLVPGMKEPYAYASQHFLPPPVRPGEILLDASTGYALNPETLKRMPEHNTKIILCVRNYFERCFSAYTFYRTTVRRDKTSVALLSSIPDHLELSRADKHTPPEDFLYEHFFKIYKIHAPVKSAAVIRNYYELQARNVLEQSFAERVRYEIGFFLSRRQLPFFSVLSSSFLTHPLKNLLAKYRAEDIYLVSMSKLNDPARRKALVEELTGSAPDNLSALQSLNATRSNAKSEFDKPELADLKYYFSADFESFMELLGQHGLSTRYVDLDDLRPA